MSWHPCSSSGNCIWGIGSVHLDLWI